MKLSGKVAIVTAAAGVGIGQATTRTLAENGAQVVISDAHASRPATVANAIKEEFGVSTMGVQCDVTDRAQVDEMVKKTLDAFGRIDILVNNAGTNRVSKVVDMTDESWDLVINVNLKGTFYCTRAVLPTMIGQKGGKIINLSSVAGWMGAADDGAPYCTAKAGLQAFTKVVAHEVAEHNINVNAIAPGLIPNEFLGRLYPQEFFEEMRQKTPIKRDGRPSDIANAILFLVSEDSSFITGETLCVSGGVYMR
ncbi:MAG: 3-oxoacyl-ACP reductase family protein [Dehalococcoidia bacterium]|jgi:3-oxoacyl-[acyl-carrier protein] reductase|nr:3-oxoacyl-ACP reductase family protein [Dehalococcoidia bacterium]MDP7469347.1 3-oxoacyl-ACP reductase family protein [Dehalococcoidia bacterium]